MTDKTLDEHAAAVERRNEVPLDRAYADILAAYEAERAARVALEARVRELEAERDMLRGVGCNEPDHEGEPASGPCGACLKCARRDLAETRAQLARLREAAEERETARELFDNATMGDEPAWTRAMRRNSAAKAALEAALSTPGPALAEIRRAAQVEVLREMAEATSARGDAHAEGFQTAAAAECFEIADYLDKRADDLEAGRG